MCMDYLGTDVTQCDQAVKRFSLPTPAAPLNCCGATRDAACVATGWPNFDAYGFDFQETSVFVALTWEEIKGQIDANKPVAFAWEWIDDADTPNVVEGGGHMMVIYGYYTDADGVHRVRVHDPAPAGEGATMHITYEEYVENPGVHRHWKDFYGITKRPGPGARMENPRRAGDGRFRTIGPVAAAAAAAWAGAAYGSNPAPEEVAAGQPQPFPVPAPPAPAAADAQKVVDTARAAVTDSQAVGLAGLKTLQAEAENDFSDLGFTTLDEARAARLGDGLAVFRIRLGVLKGFQPGQSLVGLLRPPPERVIWAVPSGAQVRSSVTTDLRGGIWTASRFGAANTIKGITRARAALNQHTGGTPPEATYVVSVPSLNVILVAHQDGAGNVVMAPTSDHSALALKVTKPEPAADILPRLADAAKKLDATHPG
jgi:Peptidase_C39 like family